MVTWTHEAGKRLLVEIYGASATSIDWEDVARHFGDGCTAQALRQHVRFLKKQVETSSKAASSTDSGASKAKRVSSPNNSVKDEEEEVNSAV